MTIKHPKDFSVDEVAMWFVAIGLGSKADGIKGNAVDGAMLVSLGADDFKELGLSSLQSKKVLTSLEASKAMAEGGGGEDPAAAAKIAELENEVAALKAQLAEYQKAMAPAPAPKPAPAPAPKHAPPPRGQVVGGAARGAARGAALGAIAGAIAGDPAQGAKIGAAVGGTRGGMDGLAARRRARMVGRY